MVDNILVVVEGGFELKGKERGEDSGGDFGEHANFTNK